MSVNVRSIGTDSFYDTDQLVQPAPRREKSGWLIELSVIGVDGTPMVLNITEDTVLGRATSGSEPEVDLTHLAGWVAGVSRRHVLLRPSTNHLYVIDLQSLVGTYHNDIKISPSEAVRLSNDDTLQLGDLLFRVNILRRPRPAR